MTLGAGFPLDATNGNAMVTNNLSLTGTTIDLGGASTAGTLIFSGSQNLAGNGDIVLGAAPGNLLQIADMNGTGVLTISTGITIHGKNGTIGALQINGSIDNHGSILADVPGGTVIVAPGTAGTFTNNDTIGATAGAVLAIQGNYASGDNAAINVGIDTGGAGLISISGTADLLGNLNVNLLNGFVPAQGHNYNIITFGSTVTGTFSAVNGLTAPGVVLTASAGQAFSLSVTMGALPDLTLGGSPTVSQSFTGVSLTATEQNIGAADAVAPFDIQVFLSADTVFGNADDILLGTMQETNDLPAGASRPFTIDAAIPAGTHAGNYNLFADIDSGSAVVAPDYCAAAAGEDRRARSELWS
jgi:hypothetical protein